MICLHAVMRHGSMVDKLVYTGAFSAYRLLCEEKKEGAIITLSSFNCHFIPSSATRL